VLALVSASSSSFDFYGTVTVTSGTLLFWFGFSFLTAALGFGGLNGLLASFYYSKNFCSK
jgi:hypothetical protein